MHGLLSLNRSGIGASNNNTAKPGLILPKLKEIKIDERAQNGRMFEVLLQVVDREWKSLI